MYSSFYANDNETCKYDSNVTLASKYLLEKYDPFFKVPVSVTKEHFSNITTKPVNATLLCHFYNEEYLLPFWLKHHRSMFSHGIMIDYHSTDRSKQIIKELCPTWEIRTSRNQNFKADMVDNEVMDIEKEINGYKMTLNVTEFLIASKPFERNDANKCFRIESYIVIPNSTYSEPENEIQFIQHIDKLAYQSERGYRSFHSYPHGNYTLGRHASRHAVEEIPSLFIVWCGFYPWNEKTIKRKLQIKDNIPEEDKRVGNGYQHLWGLERMEQEIKEFDKRKQTSLQDLYYQ
jgi:hypothetical protein